MPKGRLGCGLNPHLAIGIMVKTKTNLFIHAADNNVACFHITIICFAIGESQNTMFNAVQNHCLAV